MTGQMTPYRWVACLMLSVFWVPLGNPAQQVWLSWIYKRRRPWGGSYGAAFSGYRLVGLDSLNSHYDIDTFLKFGKRKLYRLLFRALRVNIIVIHIEVVVDDELIKRSWVWVRPIYGSSLAFEQFHSHHHCWVSYRLQMTVAKRNVKH